MTWFSYLGSTFNVPPSSIHRNFPTPSSRKRDTASVCRGKGGRTHILHATLKVFRGICIREGILGPSYVDGDGDEGTIRDGSNSYMQLKQQYPPTLRSPLKSLAASSTPVSCLSLGWRLIPLTSTPLSPSESSAYPSAQVREASVHHNFEELLGTRSWVVWIARADDSYAFAKTLEDVGELEG